jgi:putative hydrolase of the HAD superfamily
MRPYTTFVAVDADNTLWDTNAVYADAQLALLSEVEALVGVKAPGDRLAFLRSFDQDLALRHAQRLRYPVRLLAQTLARALEAPAAKNAAQEIISGKPGSLDDDTAQALERTFVEALRRPPHLRPGVMEGLQLLKDAQVYLVVFTEGRTERVQRNIDAFGLSIFFANLIEVIKNERTFTALRLEHPDAERFFAIGDQLDSDIRPAKAAGFETIYFSGDFQPKWSPEAAAIGPHHEVSDFADAARIVIRESTPNA